MSPVANETQPGLSARVFGRLARARLRFRYERIRPEISAAEVEARLEPSRRVGVAGADGFRALLDQHLRITPVLLWDHTPPLSNGELAHIRRGEVKVAGRPLRVGADTDWHADPIFGVRWPRRHVDSMPYAVPGSDLVLLWHLNKMFFLLDHAAAYRTTGDAAFARAAYAVMDAWSAANPFLVGANWMSPLETGTRLVVWSQTLAGLRDAGAPDDERSARIVRALIRQTDFLAGHFSERPVPNNHLIGEAAALFALCAYWPELADSPARMQTAERTLLHEVGRQILPDGFDYECSVNYHLYVLDWLLLYLHAKALISEEPPAAVLAAASAMARAAVVLVSPSGRWPAIGDDSIDEFFILDPDGASRRNAGELLFADFLKPAYAALFATRSWARAMIGVRAPLEAAAHLRDAGITVARDAAAHLVFSHGPQHRRLFSHGHMHADAASFELELDGQPVIVDAGTYLYTYDPALRRHMRGARAHNAPVVDGVEPMEGTGAFEWASIHTGEYLGSGFSGDLAGVGCRRGIAAAAAVPLEHTRAVIRSGETVLVVDTMRRLPGAAPGPAHLATLAFRTPTPRGTARVEATHVRLADPKRFFRVLEAFSDCPLHVDVVDDPADPTSWHSPRYGVVRTGVTVRVAAEFEDTLALVTVIRPPEVAVTPLELTNGRVVLAVETAHRRRVARIEGDPFRIAIGGHTLVGRDPAGTGRSAPRPVPVRGPSDLAWLDELS